MRILGVIRRALFHRKTSALSDLTRAMHRRDRDRQGANQVAAFARFKNIDQMAYHKVVVSSGL